MRSKKEPPRFARPKHVLEERKKALTSLGGDLIAQLWNSTHSTGTFPLIAALCPPYATLMAHGDGQTMTVARMAMSAFFSRRLAAVKMGQGAAALRAVTYSKAEAMFPS